MSKTSSLPIILIDGVPMEFTYDGEINPSAWLYLSDGTYLEIEHEERMPVNERYFYVRHHCSCRDYRMGLYSESEGCMLQMTADSFSEAARMVRETIEEAKTRDIHIEDLRKTA